MHRLRIDLETRSTIPIELGSYRYAEGAEIIIMACAVDDEEVLTWSTKEPTEGNAAIELYNQAVKEGWEIEAHNIDFEWAVIKEKGHEVGMLTPEINQLRCTAAMARRATIPHSLEKAGDYLNIDLKKQKEGKRLIQVFSIPNAGGDYNHRDTEGELTLLGEKISYSEAWDRFVEYCAFDVEAQRQISKRLHVFDMTGTELDSFHFNLRCNTRGVPFNRGALEKAVTMADEATAESHENFVSLTGLKPTQNIKVKTWMVDRGYPHNSMGAALMQETLDDIPSGMAEEAVTALRLKAAISYSAIKKFPSILSRICNSGRTHGDLMWYGALRTGRWTSTGVNIQNVKRPVIPMADIAYEMIRDGYGMGEIREWFSGSAEAILASTVRNFIEIPGELILDADYSNIEGRVGAYLCGQTNMLDDFRNNIDGYKVEAASVLSKKYEDITKAERHLGKEIRLSCIFQTGAKTLYNTILRSGNEVSKELCVKGVEKFREVNSGFPKTWNACSDAAVKSILSPEKWFDANAFISFKTSKRGPFDMLIMRLPSGRCIVYPEPRYRHGEVTMEDIYGEKSTFETDIISFYGIVKNKQWGRKTTYGGDLFQSSTQGTARDLMVHGCLEAEREGFEIFSLIHDQALAHSGDPDLFIECLCRLPDWMPSDFPLEAEGGLVKRYSKD